VRGKIKKRIVARVCVGLLFGVAGWILAAARCGAATNYLDGVKDFPDLVQRIEENNSPQSIRRNKDGAVEYINLGFARDENLVLISQEPSIREVSFIGTRAAEKGFAALQQMTNLNSLAFAAATGAATPWSWRAGSRSCAGWTCVKCYTSHPICLA
jgi:hypothetical protein